MKIITDFTLSASSMSSSINSKQFVVRGEFGAEFMLQVFNSDNEFYNWTSKAFESGSSSANNLVVQMDGVIYSGGINFPANASGDTYFVLLFAFEEKDTKLNGFFTNNTDKSIYTTSIDQVADTVLTFIPNSTDNASKYATWSSGNNVVNTSTPATVATSITKSIDWDIVNASNDSHGFGLRLIRQPIDTDWYFQTTEDAAADNVDNTVVVSDLTDLATGMEMIYYRGTTAPGATTKIIEIDVATKTLKLSRTQAISSGNTMTFRAYGSSAIEKSIGAIIDFSSWINPPEGSIATSVELSKTVRANASGNDIALNGTYGISGGGFVTISGGGIKNTAENLIQSVDPGSTDGSITTEETQTVKTGAEIFFSGSSQQIDIEGEITINKMPSANRNIYLELDKFITPGVSGS